MTDNTTIEVLGYPEIAEKAFCDSFDWKLILESSRAFEQNPYNQSTFLLRGSSNIAVDKKYICVHPNGSKSFEGTRKALTRAVASYYRCGCYIWGEPKSGLRVQLDYNPMKLSEKMSKIRIVCGDIAKMSCDMLVNPTDENCSGSGGVDQALHEAAGEILDAEIQCILQERKLAVSEAIVTSAGQMSNTSAIIHVVGPTWMNGYSGEELALVKCYRKIFELAIEHQADSIAIPCISVGAHHFPVRRAAEIALNTILGYHEEEGFLNTISRIVLVCTEDTASEYKEALKDVIIARAVTECELGGDGFDYDIVESLAEMEWNDLGLYNRFSKNFTEHSKVKAYQGDIKDQAFLYAMTLDAWDYDTCLAYIIFLQRMDYWSGGQENNLGDQYANGTLERVLKHMQMIRLLSDTKDAVTADSAIPEMKAEPVSVTEFDHKETSASRRNSAFIQWMKKSVEKKLSDKTPEVKAEPPKTAKQYDLNYILSLQGAEDHSRVGDVRVTHDVSLNKWRLMVQLDKDWYYFLSVFIYEDGSFDKYSLDYEAEDDSHYEFQDDTAIRKKLYQKGDEDRYLHEILIRYVEEKGSSGLTGLISSSVTAQFHYY